MKHSYYDELFHELNNNFDINIAFKLTLEDYLFSNKNKKNRLRNDELFWSSGFLVDTSVDQLQTDEFVLGLTRYFKQDKFTNDRLIKKLIEVAPHVVIKAIKRAEAVLDSEHFVWRMLETKTYHNSEEISSFRNTMSYLHSAYQDRIKLLNEYKEEFKSLTLVDFLAISSIYSFKHLIESDVTLDNERLTTGHQIRAMSELTKWKLKESPPEQTKTTEGQIAQSVKKFQSPLLFPSSASDDEARSKLSYFRELLRAQVEMDEFLERSIYPFCFDDTVHYFVQNGSIRMNKLGVDHSWERNGCRQTLLRGYWQRIAIEKFIASGMATQLMGSQENHERNQLAYVRALANSLQLERVYGLNKFLPVGKGFEVDLFQALLTLELMTAFYIKDYIEEYHHLYSNSGDWQIASGQLAMEGLLAGENRFPLTWSEWSTKAKNLVGWTVSERLPKGSLKAAEANLNFWCLNLGEWREGLLSVNEHENQLISERPIFKLGKYCIQLPWLMSSQLSSVSAVNNLRRYANKRATLKEETSRIESNVGDAFERRGFTVLRSYTSLLEGGDRAGEIDLVCALDNIVFVIEVKSTFYRSRRKEIRTYLDQTLMKAGIQARRKTEMIEREIGENPSFLRKLNLKSAEANIVGLIVDTSLEFDHEYFAGFLKVSIEEILIALADNAHFLCDLENLGKQSDGDIVKEDYESTLYPEGFNAKSFLNVIQNSLVWKHKEAEFSKCM